MANVVEGYLPGKQRGTHITIEDGVRVMVERIENAGIIVKDLKGKVLEHYEKRQMADFNKKYKSVKAQHEKSQRD